MGGERRATNESDHEKLVQALNMIIGVAMGERLDSMRHTAKELDSRLSTLIGSAKKETTDAIDSVRSAAKELDSKLSARVVSADPSQDTAGIQTGAFGTTAPAQPASEGRPTTVRGR